MTKTGKTIVTILAIVLPLGVLVGLVMWGRDIFSKIKIVPYFVSVDFKGLSLQDAQDILANGGEKTINAVLGIQVLNDSGVNIPFSGMKAQLYYNGIVLAETTKVLENQKFVAKAHNTADPLRITETVIITLSRATAQLLIQKLLGRETEVGYTIEMNIFGLPILKWFPIKNTFKW